MAGEIIKGSIKAYAPDGLDVNINGYNASTGLSPEKIYVEPGTQAMRTADVNLGGVPVQLDNLLNDSSTQITSLSEIADSTNEINNHTAWLASYSSSGLNLVQEVRTFSDASLTNAINAATSFLGTNLNYKLLSAQLFKDTINYVVVCALVHS